MADEIMTTEEQELFQLSNGRYIMDKDLSQKMAFKLAAATPFQFQQHPFFQFRRYQNENIPQIVMLCVRVEAVVFMDKVR